MIKYLTLILSLFLLLHLRGQDLIGQSKVFENGIVKSSILNEEMRFAIYLPSGYESSGRDYPVVYLLHGRTDDHTAWVQFGEMQRIVDEEIRSGKIAPMIIVMPDAKLTFYINNFDGSYNYEDYFIKELIPYIEKNYRSRSKKEFRAVAGLSMGGFGALFYSLKYPDMFTACSALSAAVRTDEEMINMPDEKYNFEFAPIMGGSKKGKDRITGFYNNHSILYLVKNIPENQKNSVRLYLDCGDGDFLYKGNSALHILMSDLNFPHEFRVRDGIHDWEYWRTGLADALSFISRSFHR
ncbi:MAG: alpha/beta hydrolase [Ignavibacteria bacterium]